MTDKESIKVKLICAAVIILLIGMSAGAVIVSLRIDAEIRIDQLELQAQVAKIIADKAMINDLVNELISQIEAIKVERKSLGELKILLSKGE